MRVLLGPDLHRLVHEGASKRDDRAGHGGREQHRLPAGRQHRQQLLDVRQETEVEHLVGLVQDQDADAGQGQVMLLDEIEQPAWSADDDVDASIEGLHLRFVRPATVDGGDPGTEAGAGRGEITGYLDRQFSSRGDDECLRTGAGRTRQIKPVEQRDAEPERLSGAGSGLPDQIGSGQRDRERHLLDREGADDAGGGKGRDDLRSDGKVRERRAVWTYRCPRSQRLRRPRRRSGSGGAGPSAGALVHRVPRIRSAGAPARSDPPVPGWPS